MSKAEKLIREDSDLGWRMAVRQKVKDVLQSHYVTAGFLAGVAWWLDPTGIGIIGEALTFGIKLMAATAVGGGAKAVAVGLLDKGQGEDAGRREEIVAKLETQKTKLIGAQKVEAHVVDAPEEYQEDGDDGVPPPMNTRTY